MSIFLSSKLESTININEDLKPSTHRKKTTLLTRLKIKFSDVWNAEKESKKNYSKEGVWCINVGYVWPDKDS